MKNSNAAQFISTFGLATALMVGSISAPAIAIAAEQNSTSDQNTHVLVSAVTRDLPGQIMTKVDQITEQQCSMEAILASGQAVEADTYLSTLPADTAWTTCGASTYGLGDGLLGAHCSDGSEVTLTSMGVAHKTLPLGTKLQIVYEGKVVNVTVCDRGPFVAGRDIDLQPGPAAQLGFNGVGRIEYRVIE